MIQRMYLMAVVCVFFASVPNAANALEERKNTASLGIESQYHRFKKDSAKESGFLYGANGAYTYRGKLITEKLPKGMFRLEGSIILGRVKFEGEQLNQFGNSTPYVIKNVKDYNSEFRALTGYDFSVLSSTKVTPYAGLGYRYFKDDLSRNNAGYRRYSHYFYMPIGVETRTPLKEGWSAGVMFEYDLFWFGRQEIALSDLDPLYSDFGVDQNGGYGFKGSIKIRKEMDDKNFVFEPYVNYWNIDASDIEPAVKYSGAPVYTYRERKNTTTEIGMKVGVEF